MRGKVNRRDFLKQSALAGAATFAISKFDVLASGARRVEVSVAPKKILILGAGLAGMVAADELIKAGHDVTILEARTRPGGRVFTFREPFSDGMYAEAGAARIHSTHNYTLKYVKEFGLTLDPFYPKNLATVTYLRGKRIKVMPNQPPDFAQLPVELTEEEKKLGPGGLFQKYVAPAMKDVGNPLDASWPSADLKKIDNLSVVDFMRQRGLSPSIIALFAVGFANPEKDSESALWFLTDSVLDAASTGFSKIRGGTDLLPRAFADKLKEKIRYGAPVVKIEHGAENVRVTFLHAGAPETMTADRLLITIPFTVLRRIETVPRFSPPKQRVIDNLTLESVSRVYLQSRKRFWLDDGFNGFGASDLPAEIWQPMHDAEGPRGILMSYIRGVASKQLTAMKEAERVEFGLNEMEKIYPGIRANFEGGFSKCWDEDEWQRGAYTIYRPGEMVDFFPLLARAEGRIHFAGEHASHWPGWMQGALESGTRAAQEINQA